LPQRKLFFPLKEIYQDKILQRKKWTTLRSFPFAAKLGLEAGESAWIEVKRQSFILTNLGPKTVAEAGGKEAMWVSEGFDAAPKFEHVNAWLGGYGRLFLYTIYSEHEWLRIYRQPPPSLLKT
jgi:hypothetical protein